MSQELDLKNLGNPLRDIKKEFDTFITPHRTALWKYCYSVTGSAWDAEDLVQETLIKAFSSLAQLWQPLNPKGYLFRIASNTWIDQCRKNRIKFDSLDIEVEPASPEEVKVVELNAAFEKLVVTLPPRQRVVLLLIDVFQFKADEVGDMIGATEGAVKALLNRARVKMNGEINNQSWEGTSKKRLDQNRTIINEYIDAFNKRDPDGLARLLDEHVSNDIVHVAQEYGKETVRKYSLTDWAQDPVEMVAELHFLWGKPALVQLTMQEGTTAVYGLNVFEIEGNKIVRIKDYYFCPELLEKVAGELGYNVYPRQYTI